MIIIIIEPEIPGKIVKKPSIIPKKVNRIRNKSVILGYSVITVTGWLLILEIKQITLIPRLSQKRLGFIFSALIKSGIENKTSPLNKMSVLLGAK